MSTKYKLEAVKDLYKQQVEGEPMRNDGIPKKRFFDWVICYIWKLRIDNKKLRRELKIKREVLALIRTREQKRKDEIFKVVPEVVELDDGINL